MTRTRKIALASGGIALGLAATLTYAVLPSTNVDPNSVPIGALSGADGERSVGGRFHAGY
jgi:hypothetical protein